MTRKSLEVNCISGGVSFFTFGLNVSAQFYPVFLVVRASPMQAYLCEERRAVYLVRLPEYVRVDSEMDGRSERRMSPLKSIVDFMISG